MPHVWGKDEKEVMLERCVRSGCSVRQIPGGGSWQRKRGGHWRSSSREPLPPCTGQEAPTPPEPTTAEAFGRARECLAMHEVDSIQEDGLHALALLERRRRMGAMAPALTDLRSAATALAHGETSSEEDREALRAACVAADAALTGAPPVFTLEEVADAMLDAGKDMKGDDTPADFRDYVRDRLAALRRG